MLFYRYSMSLEINRKLIKNGLILFILFSILMLCLSGAIRNISTISFVTIVSLFTIWKLLEYTEIREKSFEDAKMKLIQSHLDGRFMFKILDSLKIDPKYTLECLQNILDNILNYFLFYSISIYKITDEPYLQICRAGEQICKSGEYDPREARILADFFEDTNKQFEIIDGKYKVFMYNDSIRKFKLFIIPLKFEKASYVMTFRQHEDIVLSKSEKDLIKRIMSIVEKLLSA